MARIRTSGRLVHISGGFWAREANGERLEIKLHAGLPRSLEVDRVYSTRYQTSPNNRWAIFVRFNERIDPSTLSNAVWTIPGATIDPVLQPDGRTVRVSSDHGGTALTVSNLSVRNGATAPLRSMTGAAFRQRNTANERETDAFTATVRYAASASPLDATVPTPTRRVELSAGDIRVYDAAGTTELTAGGAATLATPLPSDATRINVTHRSTSGDVRMRVASRARWVFGTKEDFMVPWSGTETASAADRDSTVAPAYGAVSSNAYPIVAGTRRTGGLAIKDTPSGIWVMFPATPERLAAESAMMSAPAGRTLLFATGARLRGDGLLVDDQWSYVMETGQATLADRSQFSTGPDLLHVSGRNRLGHRTGGMRLVVRNERNILLLAGGDHAGNSVIELDEDSELHWFGAEIALEFEDDYDDTVNLYGIASRNPASDIDLTIRSVPTSPGDTTFAVARARFGRMTAGTGRALDITLVDTYPIIENAVSAPFDPTSLRQVEGANLGGSGNGAGMNVLNNPRSNSYVVLRGYAPTGSPIKLSGGGTTMPVDLRNPTLDLAELNANRAGTRVSVDVRVTARSPAGAALAGVPVDILNTVDAEYGTGDSPGFGGTKREVPNTKTSGTTGSDGIATIQKVIWSARAANTSGASGREQLTDGTAATLRVRAAEYMLVEQAVTLAASGVNDVAVTLITDMEAPAASTVPSGTLTINAASKTVTVPASLSAERISPRVLYGMLKRDLPDSLAPFFTMAGRTLTLADGWNVTFETPDMYGLRTVTGDTSNHLTLQGTGRYMGTLGDGMSVTDARAVTVRLNTGQAGAKVVHSKVDSRIILLVADGTSVLKAYSQAAPNTAPARLAASDIDVSAAMATGEEVRGMSYVPERRAILLALWNETASTARVAAVSPTGTLLGASTFSAEPGEVNSICYIDPSRMAVAHADGASWRLDIADPSRVFANRALELSTTLVPTGPQEILSVSWTGQRLVITRSQGLSVIIFAYTLSGGRLLSDGDNIRVIGTTVTYGGIVGTANLVEIDRSRPSHMYFLHSEQAQLNGVPLIEVDYPDGRPATWTTWVLRALPGHAIANGRAFTAFRDTRAVGEVVATAGSDGIARIEVPNAERASERGVTVKKEGFNPVHITINPSIPDHSVSLGRNTDIDTSIDISDYDLTASGGATKNIHVALGATASDTEIRFSDTYDLKAAPEKTKRLLDALMTTDDGVKFLHRYYEAPSPNNMGRAYSIHPTFVNILPGWLSLVRKASLPANSRAVFGVSAYTGDDETFYRPPEKNGGFVEIADPTVYLQFDTPRIRTVSREVREAPANRAAIGDAVWAADVSAYETGTDGTAGKELYDAQATGSGGGGTGLTANQGAALDALYTSRAHLPNLSRLDASIASRAATGARMDITEGAVNRILDEDLVTHSIPNTVGKVLADVPTAAQNAEATHERQPAADDPANSLGQRIRSMDAEIGNLHTRLTMQRAANLDNIATAPATASDIPSAADVRDELLGVAGSDLRDVGTYASDTLGWLLGSLLRFDGQRRLSVRLNPNVDSGILSDIRHGIMGRAAADYTETVSGGGDTFGKSLADAAAKAKRLDFAGSQSTGEADLKATLDGEDVGLKDEALPANVRASIPTSSGGATAADIADAVWDELAADHDDTGSFGANLDAMVSTRSSHGAPTIAPQLTQDQIRAAVWNALASDYNASRTMGAAAQDQGATSSQVAQAVASHADITAIKSSTDRLTSDVVGRIDASISSRATQTSVDAIPTSSPAFPTADITAIKRQTDKLRFADAPTRGQDIRVDYVALGDQLQNDAALRGNIASAVATERRVAAMIADARIARKMLTNRQVRDPTTSMITTYDDDGTTPLRRHGLKRRDGGASEGAEAFEREAPTGSGAGQ